MKETFRVVTYNILADAYVKPNRYPLSSPDALEPEGRRQRLLDKLRSLDADVYCLQEVEPHVFDAIQGALPADAYHHAYAQKHGRPDGCAIVVRRAGFEVCDTKTMHYEAHDAGDDQLALLAHLRHKGHDLVIASTHLRWQPDSKSVHEHIGCLQMMELLSRREQLFPGIPCWIITGDFNANSQSPVVTAALTRGFRLSCRSQRPWDTTNINRRRRKLDYLLYTPEHLVPSPGQLPTLDRETPMPSMTEPSDHLAVSVDYAFCD